MDQYDDVSAVFHEGGLGDVLDTLDTILDQHGEEEETLEVARETAHDVYRGIENYTEAKFYTKQSLDDFKSSLPGTTFSELSNPYVEPLTNEDGNFTLWLAFECSYDDTYPVDTDYDNLAIHVPTEEAAFRNLHNGLYAEIEASSDDR